MNFYNTALQNGDDYAEHYAKLGEALRLLTSATHGVSSVTHSVAADAFALPAQIAGIPTGLGEVQAKPIKRKAEKDPNAPKKPLTVFFAYSAYTREKLKEDREAKGLTPLSSTEITQEISKLWNELGEDEKEKWKAAYVEELARYQIRKEKYLEAKKNGEDVQVIGPNAAPIAIPPHLFKDKSKKRSTDEADKKEKKKKSKKRKSEAADHSHIAQ